MEWYMSPQCEDGYTKIANELLEALCQIRVAGEQMQVFLTILRKTYGFGKKMDKIALSQFSESTGLKKPHVMRALHNLMNLNIIIKNDNDKIVSYGVNKDYSSWQPLSKRITTFIREPILKKFCYICSFFDALEGHHIVQRSKGGSNQHTNIINLCPNCHALTHKGKYTTEDLFTIKDKVENVTNNDNGLLPILDKPLSKKVTTKETLTKETTQKKKEEGKLLEICRAWKAFVEMRIKIKKPMTPYAMELRVKDLFSLQSKGNDPVAVLNQSTASNYQDLYPIKENANDRSGNSSRANQTGRKTGIVEANGAGTDFLT